MGAKVLDKHAVLLLSEDLSRFESDFDQSLTKAGKDATLNICQVIESDASVPSWGVYFMYMFRYGVWKLI
jgi:hypothetical protein